MNAIAITESAGAVLLRALLNEVKQLPKPWQQVPEREQEVVIDRLRRATESAMRQAVLAIATGRFPTVPATVESVLFKDGVKAVLTLSKGAAGTHELADATGHDALVVIASVSEFLEGLDRVKADADQGDMFSGTGEFESVVEGGDEVSVQELLARVHVSVDEETCDAWTDQEVSVAAAWAIAYANDPEKAPARPHWLPVPQPPSDAQGEPDAGEAEAASEAETTAEA